MEWMTQMTPLPTTRYRTKRAWRPALLKRTLHLSSGSGDPRPYGHADPARPAAAVVPCHPASAGGPSQRREWPVGQVIAEGSRANHRQAGRGAQLGIGGEGEHAYPEAVAEDFGADRLPAIVVQYADQVGHGDQYLFVPPGHQVLVLNCHPHGAARVILKTLDDRLAAGETAGGYALDIADLAAEQQSRAQGRERRLGPDLVALGLAYRAANTPGKGVAAPDPRFLELPAAQHGHCQSGRAAHGHRDHPAQPFGPERILGVGQDQHVPFLVGQRGGSRGDAA